MLVSDDNERELIDAPDGSLMDPLQKEIQEFDYDWVKNNLGE